jgi:hypothetical protein
VTDLDEAIRSAKIRAADVVVAPFNDPIGRERSSNGRAESACSSTGTRLLPTMPSFRPFPKTESTCPSGARTNLFANSWPSHSVASDDARAPGVEIGRPNDMFRRVRIASTFGTITVLATDGHIPYP